MPAPRLSKGENLALPPSVGRLSVCIGWTDPELDVDASALLLGSNRKVGSDSDFVFYNQPASPGGSVRLLACNAIDGGGGEARIAIDLSTLPAHISTVAVIGSLVSHSFGDLGMLVVTFTDGDGHLLADYICADASTESALQFGEVYRYKQGWKIKAVGQGWTTGLAGLAMDFGVNVDGCGDSDPSDDDSAAVVPAAELPVGRATPRAYSVQQAVGSAYRLWTRTRANFAYELTSAPLFEPAIRSLCPPEIGEQGNSLELDVDLVPEPDGPQGQWSVSVRSGDRTIGYLGAEEAQRWAGVFRRIVCSGFVPRVACRIWASEYDGFDEVQFRAYVRLPLEDPECAIPLNEPPAMAYTLLPRSSIVQVTKDGEHFDVLRSFVPRTGYGLLVATLHESPSTAGNSKAHVEVRVDDRRVGQLTPQMSQRFLPMIQHLDSRGLITACWADITGSAVAAKIRIDAIKAHEATEEVLRGPANTIPVLRPALSDPRDYDLSVLRALLDPLPLVRPAPPPPTPPEPPDGSLIRFQRGRHYTFLAVRRGDQWETTATGNWGAIDQVMSWDRLARKVRKFEMASAWQPVGACGDASVRNHLAAIRFTIGGTCIAAINVGADGREDGDWYTTITDEAEERLSLGGQVRWSEIARCGRDIQVATAWAPPC